MKLSVRSLLILSCNLFIVAPAFARHHGPLRGLWLPRAYQALAAGNIPAAERDLARAGFGGANGHIPAAWNALGHGNVLGALNQINEANLARNGTPAGPPLGFGGGGFPGGFPGGFQGGGYRALALGGSPFPNPYFGRPYTGFGSFGFNGAFFY